MAPFSNRIADGAFQAMGKRVRLRANLAGVSHAIHGFAWQASWRIVRAEAALCEIAYAYRDGEWPWPFEVCQRFEFKGDGLTHAIEMRNLSDQIMPAGLGLHPYFPRTERTRYHGLHCGEWSNSDDCLPRTLMMCEEAKDWWSGRPVCERPVDTVYVEREGPLSISWPDRALELRIEPSDIFRFTTIYAPADADFFCVEPVSHMTDALNHPECDNGVHWLEAGASICGAVRYVASRSQ